MTYLGSAYDGLVGLAANFYADDIGCDNPTLVMITWFLRQATGNKSIGIDTTLAALERNQSLVAQRCATLDTLVVRLDEFGNGEIYESARQYFQPERRAVLKRQLESGAVSRVLCFESGTHPRYTWREPVADEIRCVEKFKERYAEEIAEAKELFDLECGRRKSKPKPKRKTRAKAK